MINIDNSDLIEALKKCGAVKFGEFTLASGKKSNYYVDIKKASTDPETLKIIAEKAAKLIADMDEGIVGGVELGGVPIATAVSLETKLPLIIVRKSTKEYGTKGKLVGEIRENTGIIMLEDVTTSGGSVKDAILSVREEGGSITKVITVVDRESGAKENLKEIGVELIPLVSAGELLKNN